MARQGGGTCKYCHRIMRVGHRHLAPTRDHFEPRSKRGKPNGLGEISFRTRTVPCCRQCNTLKADMLPAEWQAFMRTNPRWWERPEFQGGLSKQQRAPYRAEPQP